jgi:spore maturation protein CgeB
VNVLYVGMKYDYGQPERGLCHEYCNLFDTLKHMVGVEVSLFAFDEILRQHGRDRMNAMLLDRVEQESPDLVFFVLFTDEIAQSTIDRITRRKGTATVNWFCDDHWRFDSFSRYYAPSFQWVVTTDSRAMSRYKDIGCEHVIKSQWGFNSYAVLPQSSAEEFDVTFIGQVHSRRRQIIDRLRTAGIDVRCWGRGWPNGRLAQEELHRMFRRSRINLNFTESSIVSGVKPLAKIVASRRADGSIHLNSPRRALDQIRSIATTRCPQIKGRNFEIPGAGGFLLTAEADNLDEYFVPEKEIGVFSSFADLVEKIHYYLTHPEERERVRAAGHERTIREHSYERRLSEILSIIGTSEAVNREVVR